MSYLEFHALFVVPPIVLLALAGRRPLEVVGRRAGLLGLALISLLALSYTTPWDSHLIRQGVWAYGEEGVVATLWGVPLEEYLFFVLQPLLAGLWLYRMVAKEGAPDPASPRSKPRPGRRSAARWGGTALWSVAGLVGVLLLRWEPGLYLGLVLAWASPVLALQWAYGGSALWRARRTLLLGAAVPTVYLWFADHAAIGLGVWDVSARYSTGLDLLGLPLEEAVFFAVTDLMVVQGLLLFLWVMERLRERGRPFLTSHPGRIAYRADEEAPLRRTSSPAPRDEGPRPTPHETAATAAERPRATVRIGSFAPERGGRTDASPPRTTIPTTLDPPPAARASLVKAVLWPSWVIVGSLSALFALGLDAPPVWVQCLPFAASLVLFGLPHGATDHLAVPRLLGRTARPGLVLGVALPYLLLAGLYLAFWFAFPAAAFVLFVTLTWFHWGQGDLWSLVALLRAGHLPDGPSLILALFVRGGLPMLVPLLAFPEVYRSVAGDLVGLSGSGALEGLEWVFEPAFGVLAGTAFAALALGVLALGHGRASTHEDPKKAWRADAFETVLLAAYFALVPPLLAVGLYFCLWHSARHVARLMLLGEAAVLRRGRLVPAFVGFFRDSAPLTAVALLLLAGLYVAAPGPREDPRALLAVCLVLVSALTLPHVAVVCWMDRKEDLFSPGRSGGSDGPR